MVTRYLGIGGWGRVRGTGDKEQHVRGEIRASDPRFVLPGILGYKICDLALD